MGDVIKFPGEWHGEPKDENQEQAPEININHVGDLIVTLASIYADQPMNKDLYQEITETLKTVKNENIVSLINYSGKTEWLKNPTYYHVLVDEAKRRGLIP